jgi:hypothetical protein
MKTLALIFSTILICFSLASCDDTSSSMSCDKEVIVSSDEYNTSPDDQVTINTVELNGDCLAINFSSSGSSGNSWELELIAPETFLLSSPPQKNLRLSLKNEELCQAYITKELTFDISEAQGSGSDILWLNIMNYDDQIPYEY